MSEVLIKSGTPTELKFQLQVEGADSPVKEVRFTVPLKHELKLSYQGNVMGDSVEFNVEGLEKHLVKGIHDFFLEVFVGDHCFVPYQGKIKLEEPLLIKAELKGQSIAPPKHVPKVSVIQSETVTVKSGPPKTKFDELLTKKFVKSDKSKRSQNVIKSIDELWKLKKRKR
jgi:hypothetical protein